MNLYICHIPLRINRAFAKLLARTKEQAQHLLHVLFSQRVFIINESAAWARHKWKCTKMCAFSCSALFSFFTGQLHTRPRYKRETNKKTYSKNKKERPDCYLISPSRDEVCFNYVVWLIVCPFRRATFRTSGNSRSRPLNSIWIAVSIFKGKMSFIIVRSRFVYQYFTWTYFWHNKRSSHIRYLL